MTIRPELLAGLDERDAADVLALGVPVQLAAGETLFRLGDEAASLYVIRSGRIAVAMPMQIAGREENVRVDEYGPGQTVGLSTLTPPHRFTLTATAPVASELLSLPRHRLQEHLESRPAVGCAVWRNITALVGERLQVFQAMWLREMQHIVNSTHA